MIYARIKCEIRARFQLSQTGFIRRFPAHQAFAFAFAVFFARQVHHLQFGVSRFFRFGEKKKRLFQEISACVRQNGVTLRHSVEVRAGFETSVGRAGNRSRLPAERMSEHAEILKIEFIPKRFFELLQLTGDKRKIPRPTDAAFVEKLFALFVCPIFGNFSIPFFRVETNNLPVGKFEIARIIRMIDRRDDVAAADQIFDDDSVIERA